jgi:hypothetical protein
MHFPPPAPAYGLEVHLRWYLEYGMSVSAAERRAGDPVPTGRPCSPGYPISAPNLLRSVDDGQTTWSEWHWSGTRTDGQAFEMRGVTLFEIADNVIVAGRLYLEDVEPDLIGIDEVVQTLSGHRPHTAGP